jgi:hypothetical protein
MYRTLTRVIMRGMGRVSRRQSLAMLGSPSQQSHLGGDRSQRLILCRPVRVELCQGVGPLPQCTAAGSEQRLVPLCTSSLPQ